MTNRQIERQDFVDNAIFDLIKTLNPTNKEFDWNIDFIGEIRDVVLNRFLELKICTEQEFYPFIDE